MKKKGFTLVELLAVIVILAVIILIATPMILGVIEKTKKSAFEQSLNGVIKGAELYQTQSLINNNLNECRYYSFGSDVEDITVIDNKTYYPLKELNLKGELPTEGELQICNDIITFETSNGTYSGSYNGSELTINEGDLASNDFKTPIIDVFNLTAKVDKIIVSSHAYSPSAGGVIVNYYYKIDDKEYIKTSDTSYIFDNLTPNTEYTISIKVENKSGVTKEESKTIRTKAFGEITISVENSDIWKSSKKVTITGTTSEFPLEYKIEYYNSETDTYESTEFTTYTEPFDLDKMSTEEHPTAIIARYNNNGDYSDTKTFNVSKIDTSEPVLVLGSITKTTTTLTIPFTVGDNESEIASTTCVYGTTEDYGETGTVNENTCTISGLTTGTTYYYKLVTTNNSGLEKEEKGNTSSGSTSISYSTSQTPSGTTYAQSKAVTVTYTISNVTSTVRYVKTSVATTSSIDGYACGTSTDPDTCGTTATKSFAANTWYKVTSNPVVTFTANGTVYARINDGESYSASSSLNIEKIDRTAPTLTLGTATSTDTTITIPISTFTDDNLIGSISSCKYSQASGSYTNNGTISGTSSCTLNGLTTGTTYYYQVCGLDSVGNETCKTGSKSAITPTDFQVGDYVQMTPTSTSYTISTTYTGMGMDQTINPSELNLWRVIRINSDGTIDMVSQYVSSTKVYFYGKEGYKYFVATLNMIARQYANTKYTTKTRHMGYSNQLSYVYPSGSTPPATRSTDNNMTSYQQQNGAGDVGYETDTNLVTTAVGNLIARQVGTTSETTYWLASRYFYYGSSTKWYYAGRSCYTDPDRAWNLYDYTSGTLSESNGYASVRPIVTLKSGLKASSGSGTSWSPYVLP